MNIDFNECYDTENDIYYVTFKTGEPSFVQETDDILLLELGIFTKLPTGFRILNYSKHNVGEVSFEIERAKKVVAEAHKETPSILRERTRQMTAALEKAWA